MELTDKAAEILGDESSTKSTKVEGSTKITSIREDAVKLEEQDKENFGGLRKILKKKIADGEEYFTIQNPLTSTFNTDWSLDLLPPDTKSETDRYFEVKYVQFGGDKFIPGVSFIVVRRPDNSAVNLLENFLIEKNVPTPIPMSVGGEIVVKSQFVMLSNEVILINVEQKEDLLRFVKQRREWTGSDDITKSSDWLGFLILAPVTQENVLEIEFDRPLLSKEDFSLAPTQVTAAKSTRKEIRHGDMVYADDTD